MIQPITVVIFQVELRMPKLVRGERWPTLLKNGQGVLPSSQPAPPASTSTPMVKKNWDAIEKQAVKDEEDELLEGDAAINRTFRKIFENASDDTKKAMMKSYRYLHAD